MRAKHRISPNIVHEGFDMHRVPDPVWTTPVVGRNLNGNTLCDQVGDNTALLVFLRHLG